MHKRISSDLTAHDSRYGAEDIRVSRKRSMRPQISLSTILLGTALVAVWIAYVNTLRETWQLQARLPGLRRISGELQIEDARELAVIQRMPTKYGELIWDVNVPDPNLPNTFTDSGTQLCLVMDEIPPQLERSELPSPLHTALLEPGRHSIELRYDRGGESAELIVLVDGEPQITVTRAKDWESGKGWSASQRHSLETSQSFSLDEPLVLLNRRFHRDNGNGSSSTPSEPSEGILLWVQRAEASTAE